ncbi:hypothetical protein JW710_01360 [Candidatus Dojkabacteria bacterium]|nr:hypothetical protein [Candidatus Dojkabacteria bacterium]
MKADQDLVTTPLEILEQKAYDDITITISYNDQSNDMFLTFESTNEELELLGFSIAGVYYTNGTKAGEIPCGTRLIETEGNVGNPYVGFSSYLSETISETVFAPVTITVEAPAAITYQLSYLQYYEHLVVSHVETDGYVWIPIQEAEWRYTDDHFVGLVDRSIFLPLVLRED